LEKGAGDEVKKSRQNKLRYQEESTV
jgi:hypothetical protein